MKQVILGHDLTTALAMGLLLFCIYWFSEFLTDIWNNRALRRTPDISSDTVQYIQQIMDTPDESCQLLHWQVFKNTTVLEHNSWYVFRLKNGSFIVEQYDQELNWRFYVPHTDYVTAFAKLKNG
jgi:hypothetical protein